MTYQPQLEQSSGTQLLQIRMVRAWWWLLVRRGKNRPWWRSERLCHYRFSLPEPVRKRQIWRLKMDCKRQEAKRLGTGLQNRFSGFDSRLAVHFCGRKTTNLKQKTSHRATTGNHPTALRLHHATTPPRSQWGISASYGSQWQSYADHPYAGCF